MLVFNDPRPPVDLLVHGNARNHVRRNLKATCKMVGKNQASELLVAAKRDLIFTKTWAQRSAIDKLLTSCMIKASLPHKQ